MQYLLPKSTKTDLISVVIMLLAFTSEIFNSSTWEEAPKFHCVFFPRAHLLSTTPPPSSAPLLLFPCLPQDLH